MSKLSNGAKQGIIEEVLSGNGVSIRSIAKKYNIGVSTLLDFGLIAYHRDFLSVSLFNLR